MFKNVFIIDMDWTVKNSKLTETNLKLLKTKLEKNNNDQLRYSIGEISAIVQDKEID